MKKTFNLSIGGSLFNVEEDAFEKLESYISSIRSHFDGNPDKEEILADIEGRIAEKFSEKKGGIISLRDVEEVVEVMGTVEQFDGQEGEVKNEHHTSKVLKRLYRDRDNAVIAGVSSGLGHYFGIDPLIFRIIFIASIFIGGSGVVAYIILWILVPEAKTPSQKLSMRGDAVTIHAVADMLKEKLEEVNTPEHKGMFKKLLAISLDIIRNIVQFIQKVIFPSIRVLAGSVLIAGSFMLAVGVTIATSFALFAVSSTFIEGPLLPLLQSTTANILAVALYLLALIPLIFLIALGITLIVRRTVISKAIGISLVIVWFVALSVAGATGSKIGMQAADIVRNDPYYKRESQIVDLQPFTNLVVMNGQSVRIVEGAAYQLELTGRADDLARMSYAVGTSTLTLSELDVERNTNCIVCGGEYVEAILTVPSLTQITLVDNSDIRGDVEGPFLSLDLDNGSSAQLTLNVDEVTATAKNSSRVYITGTVGKLSGTFENSSRLDGEQTEIAIATIKAVNNSSAMFYVTERLDATAMKGSRIEYRGSPEVIEYIDNSSYLEDSDAYLRER